MEQIITTVYQVCYNLPSWRKFNALSFFLYESDAEAFAAEIVRDGGTASITKR